MSVTRNAVEDCFETILFMSAQNYVQKRITALIAEKFPEERVPAKNPDGTDKKDASGNVCYVTEPNILGEAIGGAANVFIMGMLMYVIRYEEKFLEKFFALVNTAIASIVTGGKAFFNLLKNKIKSRRGFSATQLTKNLETSKSERIQLASLVSDRADAVLLGRSNQQQSGTVYSQSVQSLDSANRRNETNHKIANYQVQSQMQLMLFKALSKNFSTSDEAILKKIMRNAQTSTDNPLNLTPSDLNKIADCMFIKDTSGNIIGIPETIIGLLGGLNLSTVKVAK